ncbi:LLM class F420-dependent oxidoreductase [Chloroflexus sp.]|uniref:LLM class F420-dependent oxidoreductase n=1 Tax=Chloroflexus sp. TaxID=1904827 RepID=UPI002ADD518F|nr:LLM class F420-dependent oxidoreductase [Chloroflexus sp.]
MLLLDAAFQVDANPLPGAADVAKAAEALGFAALWSPETAHNPFLALTIAAEHTQQLTIGTAVAIAFPRSPMVTAQIAWDLAGFSGGRFILGLGTQVKAHIERRFSSVWDSPVGRLRDYIGALRAIWYCWQTGGKLDYRGQYYQHTLMTPFFSPGPIAHPDIPIYIAGVNTGLAHLAGEVCDGFHAHPLTSARYLREVLRPQIAAGATAAGRDPSACAIAGSVLVITGNDKTERERMRAMVRQQIAFYASTPTYRAVLSCHGWDAVGEELSRLAAQQRWAEMTGLIDDTMVATFAVEADPADLPAALKERYEGLLDRVALYIPFIPGERDDFWRHLTMSLNGQ